jgi:hypothetical protein
MQQHFLQLGFKDVTVLNPDQENHLLQSSKGGSIVRVVKANAA